MVMKPEPIFAAVEELRAQVDEKSKIILMSPAAAITCSQMAQLPLLFWSMQSCAYCLARSVMSNPQRTIASAPDCSKRRSTRDRPNFAIGRFRMF